MEADLAAYQNEARSHSDAIRRRSVSLHQPTSGLVLWLSYGQSLAAGWESWPRLSKTARLSSVYMMGESVHPAAENRAKWAPVGGLAKLAPLVATVRDGGRGLLTDEEVARLTPGAPNRGETLLEGFAQQFGAAWYGSRGMAGGDVANRFVFAQCGVGGKTIAELSVGACPDLFHRIRDAIRLAQKQATRLGLSFSVGGLLYNQGETGYASTTRGAYASALARLIEDVRSYVSDATGQAGKLPVFLFQTGGQYAVDSVELAVARAQIQVASTTEAVFMVSGNQHVVDKDFHLTSNGTRWLGCLAGKVAVRTIIEGEGWQCTQAIRWVGGGNVVVGLFHTPVPPLQFAAPYVGRSVSPIVRAPHRGIYLEDENGPLTILNVELKGQLAIVTTSRQLCIRPRIWLGRGACFSGAICIADSDRTPLAYPYVYTAGSGQTMDEDIASLAGFSYPSNNFALADVQTVDVVDRDPGRTAKSSLLSGLAARLRTRISLA
ncbi:sialate O-acetylesterase [Roseomonas stagni]|uniref:Sialate O-acetylesterase n=1 Tax=Falsiroseomonas algicola TaxID=2716930 RepID=A0A6M1LUX6_9PROT|nr:sialate O-acetylesterase [Falsiroseomonas algicola]NGM23823.1 sialate O-acetylesterase [Falsiroseomonas algicola]